MLVLVLWLLLVLMWVLMLMLVLVLVLALVLLQATLRCRRPFPSKHAYRSLILLEILRAFAACSLAALPRVREKKENAFRTSCPPLKKSAFCTCRKPAKAAFLSYCNPPNNAFRISRNPPNNVFVP